MFSAGAAVPGGPLAGAAMDPAASLADLPDVEAVIADDVSAADLL